MVDYPAAGGGEAPPGALYLTRDGRPLPLRPHRHALG